VHEREPGLDALVGEVGVVVSDLIALQEALVDDGVGVQRADVEALVVDGRLDGLSADVQGFLEVSSVRRTYYGLRDVGLGVDGGLPEVAVVRGDVAPRVDGEAVLGERGLDGLDDGVALGGVLREKERADGVGVGDAAEDVGEEVVGRLDERAGAVAGVLFGAGGAAVLEVLQYVEGVGENAMGLATVEVDDDPDPAVRPFVGRVCEEVVRAVGLVHVTGLSRPSKTLPLND